METGSEIGYLFNVRHSVSLGYGRPCLTRKYLPQANKKLSGREISVGAERVQAQEKEGLFFVCFLSVMLWMEPSADVSVKLCTTKSHCQSFSISQELALEGQISYPDPGGHI